MRQLQQNLGAADFELDDLSRERLNEVSAPTSNDYPYGPFGVKQNGRYLDSSAEMLAELWER